MLSKEFSSASLKEIGVILKREESTISSLIRRLQNRCQEDEILRDRIKAIEKDLDQLAG